MMTDSRSMRCYVTGLLCVTLLVFGGRACAGKPVQGSGPPAGNSAWVYDATYANGEHHGRNPGSFIQALNRYNRQASPGNAITRVFSYGGVLEMYCRHGASSCNPANLIVIYNAAARRSTAAYARQLEPVHGEPIRIAPVLDGSIRADYPGSLKGFNRLSLELAAKFADKVARRMCADPQVDGVQFDLEPFNVKHKNGQYYFYLRIAADFAGEVGAQGRDPFGCVDAAHPHGRYFSVFGAAHSLSPGASSARHIRQIMTAHHNGFYIAALYDLSAQPAGHWSAPRTYAQKALRQAEMAQSGAARLGVPYQLAIPAAASAHEYARCSGKQCKDPNPGQHAQLDFVKAAVHAIRASGAPQDPFYLGTAIWAWSRSIGHAGARFYPSRPPEKVLEYLQRR